MVRYYLPGFKSGGPARSISNLTAHLSDEFEFHIITSDRDLLDQSPYNEIVINDWNQVGKAKVLYISPGIRSFFLLFKLLKNSHYDLLYLNSFFDPFFSILPILIKHLGFIAIPILIAPRGEFSGGALQLKWLKKLLFITFANASGLYRNLTWHASSNHEYHDIRKFFLKIEKKVKIAINIASDIPSLDSKVNHECFKARNTTDPLRIVFLSRISPMKNLDYALRVLAKVVVPVSFDIYGPISDDGYWNLCQKLISELPSNVFVRYLREVEHQNVSSTLSSYDLFLLPTRGENFGHAIVESFISGTPVLISDKTPWRDLYEAGVGWDLSLKDEQTFADKIQNIFEMPISDYISWRKKVFQYGNDVINNRQTMNSNRLLLELAIAE